jgi:hypothetical protein
MPPSDYNNGVSKARAYNDDNALTSIQYTGAAISNLSDTWESNKNKMSETIGNTTPIAPALRTNTHPRKIMWDFDNKLRAADTNDDNTDDVFYK